MYEPARSARRGSHAAARADRCRAILTLPGILLALGCSGEDAGITVGFVAQPTMLEPGSIFAGDGGAEVRVDRAFWTSAGVEIVTCPSLTGALLDLLIPSAHAHGEGTPTRSAEPVLESAFSRETRVLGTLLPPAAEYCRVRYELGPADADAAGLAEAPDMLGRSLLVQGAFRTPGGAWEDFEFSSALELEIRTNEYTFRLGAHNKRATVHITHDPSAWWVGIDFAASSATRFEVLPENVRRSTRLEVEW